MLDEERSSDLESLNCFMFEFMHTHDPHGPDGQTTRLMPRKDHLADLNRIWLARRYLAVPKSRQMQCTWWGVGVYTWDTIRHNGRFTLFKSIDKQHSGLAKLALLWRAKFIVEHLPKCVQPLVRIKVHKRDNILEFLSTDGEIRAMSMEGEAPAGYTGTGCLDDELARQKYGEAGFTAILPLLGITGRYTTLFTYMGLNFAFRLAHDKMGDELF
jgi:hypothetical protein